MGLLGCADNSCYVLSIVNSAPCVFNGFEVPCKAVEDSAVVSCVAIDED